VQRSLKQRKDSFMSIESACLEALEPRRLLSSVILHDKTLVVHADNRTNNIISVGYDRRERITVVLNGVGTAFSKDSVDRIYLVGGKRADGMRVIETRREFNKHVRFYSEGGNDVMVGGTEPDLFICSIGDQTINTGNGDDTVLGGAGNDTIVGGDDFKLIFGGQGNDTITVGRGRGYIIGGKGNNTITSHGDRFEIFGQGGNDTITGGGRDTLWGGGGHDVLRGGTESHGVFEHFAKLISVLKPETPKTPAS
jgi:Ca2+-binding RTX toxin-like protein